MSETLTLTDAGFYCAAGDFYIDPWLPVPRALITHAHGDHARWGWMMSATPYFLLIGTRSPRMSWALTL